MREPWWVKDDGAYCIVCGAKDTDRGVEISAAGHCSDKCRREDEAACIEGTLRSEEAERLNDIAKDHGIDEWWAARGL